jgi:hypothetical protein
MHKRDRYFDRDVLICAIVVLISLAPAAAQTPVTRPAAIRFKQVTQLKLNANDLDRSALVAAKARPQALTLRKRFAAFGVKRFNFADIDKSSVPVLVSPREELMNSVRVFARADRYTAAAHKNGALIEINGTRLPTQAPSEFRLPKTARIVQLEKAQATGVEGDALQDVRIDHTGSGVDVSFRRFGSVYNLTIDCGESSEADPEAIGPAPGAKPKAANADCSDDNALAVAKEMEVVGGGEAAQ